MEEILDFLDKAEQAGQHIPSVIAPQIDLNNTDTFDDPTTKTVAFEARQLKLLYLKLHNN